MVTSFFSFSHNFLKKAFAVGVIKTLDYVLKKLLLKQSILEWSKLKSCTGNNINMNQMIRCNLLTNEKF